MNELSFFLLYLCPQTDTLNSPIDKRMANKSPNKKSFLSSVTQKLSQIFKLDKADVTDVDPVHEEAVPTAPPKPKHKPRSKPRTAVQLPPLETTYKTPTPLYELERDQVGEALRSYVDDHIADTGLNVVSMAADLKVSRTALFTMMHESFAMTPGNYITAKRLEYATQLLKIGIKASTVAQRCGYADPKYFGKAFKKHYGVLPSQYADTLSAQDSLNPQSPE